MDMEDELEYGNIRDKGEQLGFYSGADKREMRKNFSELYFM